MSDDRLLLAQVDVSIRGLERSMNKAGITVEKASARMQKNWEKMSSGMERRSNQMANDIRRAIAGIGFAVTGREVALLTDKFVQMQNKLASSSQISGVQAASLHEIQAAAAESRAELEPYVDLYSRMLRVSGKLQASESDVARATQITARAFKAGGAAASEQTAGIMQLGQALNGILGGDELRSVRENAPLLFEGIAAGLGVTSDKLKEMGARGELTGKKVFEAILKSGEQIDAAFAVTIPQATDAARLAMDRFALRMGEHLMQTGIATSVSQGFANAIDFAANNVEALTDAVIIGGAALAGWLGAQGLAGIAAGLGRVASGATATAKAMAILKGAMTFLGGPWVVALTVAAGAIAALAVNAGRAVAPVKKLADGLDDVQARLKEIAEDAGASWSDIEQGARDAIGPVSELEAKYRELLASIRESGAAARQNAINAAGAGKLEATNTKRVAQSKVTMLEGKREAFVSNPLNNVANDRRSQQAVRDFDRRIAEYAKIVKDAESRIAEADATIEYLFTQTENEDFKPKKTDNGGGSGGSSSGATVADLRAAYAIEQARADNDEARLQALADALEIEKRTAAYVKAGMASGEARIQAEVEVINLRQAALNAELEGIAKEADARARADAAKAAAQAVALMNVERQNALEVARLAGNDALVAKLLLEADIQRRIAEYIEAGLSHAEARARVDADVADVQKAVLADIERRNELDLARLSGNETLIAQLEREEDVQRRIAEYLAAGLGSVEARKRAEADSEVAATAEARQEFRDVFGDALEDAVTTGNFGDAVKSVFADRAREGLKEALNKLSDVVFDLFSDLFSQIDLKGSGGGGGGIGDLFSAGLKAFGFRAAGGGVSSNQLYRVNEGNRPELLESGGKKYLMPGAHGMVSPIRGMGLPPGAAAGGASVTLSSPIIIQGNVTEDVMPKIERVVAENNENMMAALPGMIDGRVSDGITKGRF